MPPHEMATIGLEITLDNPRLNPEAIEPWIEGVHAFEHLLVGLAPGFVQCESRDLGSTYQPPSFGIDGGTIYVYDGVPGGIGFSEGLLERAADWYDRVLEHLTSCGCEDGCPSCVLNSWCPSGNDRLSRRGGIAVARFATGL